MNLRCPCNLLPSVQPILAFYHEFKDIYVYPGEQFFSFGIRNMSILKKFLAATQQFQLKKF